MSIVLAIETSCDDTSVAVVRNSVVLSNVVSSQTLHNEYGGIVPELASREHVKAISQITNAALTQSNTSLIDVDAVAVTYAPGLAGSLLVGLHFAKGICLRYGKPMYAINHIEAHIYSGYIEYSSLQFPSVCLVVSGGHTSLVLIKSVVEYQIIGSTKDDAAGEAFDKTAKMMGLGYPGGPLIDELSRGGNPTAFSFPRGLGNANNYDFSFSGLKTAVRLFLEKNMKDAAPSDVAASIQEAITDVLVDKTIRAAVTFGITTICLAGGVSANSRLRQKMQLRCDEHQIQLIMPSMEYCVDNAAMIGFLAELKILNHAMASPLTTTINPRPMRKSQ